MGRSTDCGANLMPVEQVRAPEMRPDGPESTMALPHPLDQLSVAESETARQVVLEARGRDVALNFRSIALEEPSKDELVKYLELEHDGKVTLQTPRPVRMAKVSYDIVRGNRSHEYTESFVDVQSATELSRRVVDEAHQAALTTYVACY
jgi:primary-amine oxidase